MASDEGPCAGDKSGRPATQALHVLHVDMDAFYASVETLHDPTLRGRPLLVGHDGPRGVVTAASYEARVFGCRSAQPMSMAKALCPHAVVVSTHFDRYRIVSRKLFDVLHSFTPTVEPLSIDEAFLDLRGSERLFGDAVETARQLKTAGNCRDRPDRFGGRRAQQIFSQARQRPSEAGRTLRRTRRKRPGIPGAVGCRTYLGCRAGDGKASGVDEYPNDWPVAGNAPSTPCDCVSGPKASGLPG